MPRSVIFQGVELTWPDAYSALDLSRLLTPSSGGVGIVALVGEADGGKPGMNLIPGGASSRVISSMFKTGPLADMARLALRSGVDPDVPSGASALLCYKTNNSTQSSLPISGVNPALTLKTKQYGEFTKYFTGQIATTSAGIQLTVRDESELTGTVEYSDFVGKTQYATLLYTGDSATALMSLKFTANKLMLTVTLSGAQTDGSENLSIDCTDLTLFQLKQQLDLILNDADAIVYTIAFSSQYQQMKLIDLDYVTVDTSVKTTAYAYLASMYELMVWADTKSLLLDPIVRGVENYGFKVPATLAKTLFTGGTRGSSTNTSVQNGFNALLEFRTNIVVPLFSSDNQDGSTVTLASVNSICRDHVQARSGILGRSECQAYVSIKGDLEDFLAECSRINSRYVAVTSQSITDVDISGETVVFPEYAFAVVCAQTQSGSPIGTPLTYKALPVSGCTQDASWTPTVNYQQLIKGGALFASADENNVIRIVAGYTSYLTDDNNGNILIETVESFAIFSYNHRLFMKQKFLGKKDYTVDSVLNAIKESLKNEKNIAKTIKDYDEKLISIISIASDLRYEVPAMGWEGINFVLPTVVGIRV